jgi:nucleotide-binding universal stress UspA family protein
MPKVLVPVDGSEPSLRAVQYLIKRIGQSQDTEIHLLNVQVPIPKAITMLINREAAKDFHRDEGNAALKGARALLDQTGVKCASHIAVGESADTIAAYAREQGCDEIILGARGHGKVLNVLLGSTTTRLLHLADVPVTVVK